MGGSSLQQEQNDLLLFVDNNNTMFLPKVVHTGQVDICLHMRSFWHINIINLNLLLTLDMTEVCQAAKFENVWHV